MFLIIWRRVFYWELNHSKIPYATSSGTRVAYFPYITFVSMVQWRHDSRLLLLLNWFLHIIKRTLHGGEKIWILCSSAMWYDFGNCKSLSLVNIWCHLQWEKLPDFDASPDLLTWRQDTRIFPACWILIGRFKFPARQPYARGSIHPSKYNGWKCWKLLQAILNVSYIYLPQGTSRACLVTNLTLIAIVVKFVHEVSRFHSYSPHAAFCWPITIVCLTSGCSGPALSVIF